MSPLSKAKDKIERDTFEKAYQKMVDNGIGSILSSSKLVKKRNIIRDQMILYYESTEEFEKCKFIKDFFDSIEKDLKSSSVADIVNSIKLKKES